MTERFTKPVLRVFRKAGWSEGRRPDTTATEAFLREWALPLLPAALAIIREFGGLKCEAADTGSWLDFDVPEALMWFEPWQAPALAWVTGQPLCPVGHGNGCVWLVAESGEVVSLKDDWLGYTREPSFPYALDTHFRADYGRTTWVYIDEDELEQVFMRLKPPEVEPL